MALPAVPGGRTGLRHLPLRDAGRRLHPLPSWLDLPETANPANRNSLQLTLYPDGAFEMTFIRLDPASLFGIYSPWRSHRFTGALPGHNHRPPDTFQLSRDLPYVGGAMVTLQATPDAGSTFAGWSGEAGCADAAVLMDTDKMCTATFTVAEIPKYNIYLPLIMRNAP